MEVAKELFLKQGYENTTLDEIAKQSGFTKGAIYHHFKSKEELLEAFVNTFTEENNWLVEIQKNSQLNGLEKLRAIFFHELENAEKIEMDTILQPCMNDPKIIAIEIKESINSVAPLIEDIITEGNKDKSMNVTLPKEMSEMMIILINVWINPGIFKVSKEEFIKKTECLNEMLQKMGIPLFDEKILKVTESYYQKLKP